MKTVMLYFGSFNPIHNGHVAIAEYVLAKNLCDELWFVVSPQNPLKNTSELIDEQERLKMVALAVDSSAYSASMKACDVEFSLPKPSYTITTLDRLREMYPDVQFVVLIGGDIAMQLPRWKESERLISETEIYLYPRRGYAVDEKFHVLADAPQWEYSSTSVRRRLNAGKDVSDMLPASVCEYINKHEFWCKEIRELNRSVACMPNDCNVLLRRGRFLYAAGNFSAALNDFKRVVELDSSIAAAVEYVKIIDEILDFRHTDPYNP